MDRMSYFKLIAADFSRKMSLKGFSVLFGRLTEQAVNFPFGVSFFGFLSAREDLNLQLSA